MNHKRNWKVFLTLLAVNILAIFTLVGASTAAANQEAQFDLAIELKAPNHVEPGGTFVVNVSYSNIGTAPSPADTWVKATLPAGTTFVSAADINGNNLPPDAIDGNTLTWQVGSIPPDGCSRHIKITVLVADDLPNDIPLTTGGEIGSSTAESNLVNNTFSVTSTVCDMAGSTKQAQTQQAKPGDVLTYTLTIRMTRRLGQGDESQREVILTDILPPASQASFLGWVGPTTGTYDGTQLRWQGQVRAGEAVTLQYRLGINGDVPPDSLVTNRARLAWGGEEMEIEPATVGTYLTEDDHMFGAQGGQWQHQYGLTLEVPPDAVQQTTRFQFRELSTGTPPPDAPPGYVFAHRAFELTAYQFGEIHQFHQPITITLRYQGSDINGLDPNTLRLWFRAGPGEPWAMLGEPQMHQNGQISVATTHFTEFALFGQGAYRISLPLVRR